MNILLIASSYHPYKGGVETVVSDLAKELSDVGDKVIVVTNLWPKSLPLLEVVAGVPVFRVPMVVLYEPSRTLVVRIKQSVTGVMLIIVVLLFRPAVINVQCVGPNGHWGKWLGELFKIPIVVSTHGERTNDSSGFFKQEVNSIMFNNLIVASKYVVCVSEASAKESLTEKVGEDSKVRVIPNAITVTKQVQSGEVRDVDVVFVGRLVDEKGIDTLLKAICILRDNVPTIRVHIVGAGPIQPLLSQLVSDLNLLNHVVFTGPLDQVAVRQELKRSKILVLPSRRESFGLVILEAANSGCAVVAARTGGIPSIIDDGINGMLFDVDAVEQLARHLHVLIVDESIRSELILKFYERLPEYDVTKFVNAYRSVFSDAVKK